MSNEKWIRYEQFKRTIQDLTPAEYERAIREYLEKEGI